MDVPSSLTREDREQIAQVVEEVINDIDTGKYDYFEIVYHRGSQGYQAVVWPMTLLPPERRWNA